MSDSINIQHLWTPKTTNTLTSCGEQYDTPNYLTNWRSKLLHAHNTNCPKKMDTKLMGDKINIVRGT